MQVSIMRLFYVLIIAVGFHFTSYAQLASSEVESMSKNADLIVLGKVTNQISGWNNDGTRIYTNATIRVEESFKGNTNGDAVVVSYPGGEVGEVGELYSHMPRFEDQEEVLVFLKKDEKNTSYKVFNGKDGKINIITDPKTGKKVTSSNVPVNSLKAQIKSYMVE